MVLTKYPDLGWRGRWVAYRNSILSSPRFQRFALRFWLTRPIARRRAKSLFDLVAGFTYSQILAACVETRLLETLAAGPRTSAALTVELDMPVAGIERLMRGAAALGLVEPIGDAWALGSEGAALLGNRGIVEMIAHHHLLYADLADPVALLRRVGGGGELSRLWPYAETAGAGDSPAVAAYSALMAASQPLIAEQVIDAYAFRNHRRLLDVGGGEGAFVSAVAARVPNLEIGLFDLPAVIDRARERFDADGLSARATMFAGNFLIDPLPGGFDIITLVRVLHDHDDEPALELLRRVRAALAPGGKLLIAEPMARTPGGESAGDAYFGFYLLAMGSGRPRSMSEIAAMAMAAGFASWRPLATQLPLTVRALVAVA